MFYFLLCIKLRPSFLDLLVIKLSNLSYHEYYYLYNISVNFKYCTSILHSEMVFCRFTPTNALVQTHTNGNRSEISKATIQCMLDVLMFLSLSKRVNVISRYFCYIHTLFHIRILHSFDHFVCKVLLSTTLLIHKKLVANIFCN